MTAAPSATLLETAEDTVRRALALGADEAEVAASHMRAVSVDVQKNDLHASSTAEETTFGVRVYRKGALGFAAVNSPDKLELACAEALALAAAAPPDPRNGLADPLPVTPLEEGPDPAIGGVEVPDLVDLAMRVVDRVRSKDARVMIDSGSFDAITGARALATSRGHRLTDTSASAGGHVFGMAVDGADIGSFDSDGHRVRRRADLERELDLAADRFVIKTVGALGAQAGESFRGTVVLAPEVVRDFVIGNLLAVLDGRAVRTGKSPYRGRVGERIASPLLELVDDARLAGLTRSTAFDREGTPTGRLPILTDGVLQGFLYDVYEGRAAGRSSTGHARGGAGSLPSIGTTNLVLRAGDQAFTRLCCDPVRAVVVSRFSGSCNPVTGEFSGVVKGGFLMKSGLRTPIKETLIAGNLHQLLLQVSGVSSEHRLIDGHDSIPALRVEDVSVTAG